MVIDGNREVRVLHRILTVRDVPQAKEERRKRCVCSGFFFSVHLAQSVDVALERALNGTATPEDSKWKGPEEETIQEAEEPLTPAAPGKEFPRSQQFHKRETAEDE